MKKQELTPEQKAANLEARREAKKQAKEAARIEAEKNQNPVKQIKITIEWKKSRTWGSNPHLEAWVQYWDGTSDYLTAKCSGCGYDKESTVIADIFNAVLKYKLYQPLIPVPGYLNGEKVNLPYGIYISQWRHYSGGIGTDCYYKIAEAIGGKFERVASGKTFDVYIYTDNKPEA